MGGKMRVVITAVFFLILFIVLGVLLSGRVASFGVAELTQDGWRVAFSGWRAVLACWPALLAGALFGVILGVALGSIVFDAQRAQDSAKAIATLQQHLAAARQAATEAKARADREALQQLNYRLSDCLETENRLALQEQALSNRLLDVQRRESAIAAQQADMQRQMTLAREMIADAEHRRVNATAVVERLRRRLAKHGLA